MNLKKMLITGVGVGFFTLTSLVKPIHAGNLSAYETFKALMEIPKPENSNYDAHLKGEFAREIIRNYVDKDDNGEILPEEFSRGIIELYEISLDVIGDKYGHGINDYEGFKKDLRHGKFLGLDVLNGMSGSNPWLKLGVGRD